VSVPARRSQVAFATGRGLSQRRACTLVKVGRSALLLGRRFHIACIDAALQRIHQVDDVARFSGRLRLLYRLAGLLGADELDHGILIPILELVRLKLACHAIDDLQGQTDHLGRQLHIGDVLECRVFSPDLVWIVQRRAHQPLAEGLEHHDALATRHTIRAMPTILFFFMASRITANAS
jgi:hypothetical protein